MPRSLGLKEIWASLAILSDGGVKVSLFLIALLKEDHDQLSAPSMPFNKSFHALTSISPGLVRYNPLIAELPVNHVRHAFVRGMLYTNLQEPFHEANISRDHSHLIVDQY